MDKQCISSTARLEARLPLDVHAFLKRAAELQGRTLTDFVVTAARDAACRTIEEAEIIRLSVEDQRLLSQALLHPFEAPLSPAAGKRWIATSKPRRRKMPAPVSLIAS